MTSNKTERHSHGIANYQALETAIANGEAPLIKQLLANQSMIALEKSYLLDLAKLNNDPAVIALIQDIPLVE
jgi:hypothetical protein